jgi:arsenical pump membrane protein
MLQATALFGLGATLGLVLVRPRFGGLRVGPALASGIGVLLMLLFGVVDRADLMSTAVLMARPLVAVASIMVTAAVAHEVGLVEHAARALGARAGTSASRFFLFVYVLSTATAAVLNNDAAILLVTTIVVAIVRRAFPAHPKTWTAFAFAVFMAAGIAPLVVSNPMNMIVASYAGIDFNAYAARMAPIWLAGAVIGYAVLRAVFARELREAGTSSAPLCERGGRMTLAQVQSACVLGLLLVAYPVATLFEGPVWIVALVGALLSAAILPREGRARRIGEAIQWDILAFLGAVSAMGIGLKNAGFVARLSDAYAHGTVAIGCVSALGSAIVNNHPMSVLNMMALHELPGAGMKETLAALIGGDIGPRLLPMGSLAGLLWMGTLRRLGLEVSTPRFFAVGAIVTLPAMAAALALLQLVAR